MRQYKISRQGTIRWLYSHQFDDIENYLEEMEYLIQRRQRLFSEHMTEEMNKVGKEAADQMAEVYAEDYHALYTMFPAMLCSSAFASIYTVFERDLIRLALDNRLSRKSEGLSVTEPTSEVRFVREALDDWKANGTDIPALFPVWTEIDCYGDVRNQIVHEDGRRETRPRLPRPQKDPTKDRSDRVNAYVANRLSNGKTGIDFNQDTLLLAPAFCREAFQVLRTFFRQLIERLPD